MELRTDEERYRREMEEFVSNHGGSTSREVVLVILPNVCAILLTATIAALIRHKIHQNTLIIIEFITIVIPCVLCCTVLSDYTITVSATMLTIALMNIFIIGKTTNCKSKTNYTELTTKRRPFITNSRSLTSIISTVCILAVDFQIFPRKFAKTEIYGYSLMDTGVGLFILSNALVAPETRNINIHQQRINNKNLSFIRLYINNIMNCIKNTAILLILGLIRIVFVELSDYQRHVTEYGVHWNFFITLACVKLFTCTIASAINSKYSLLSGLWILSMHEYALSTNGLKEWILGNSPRDDFISANREGIVSVPGYVGLYFIGIALGRVINTTYNTIDGNINKNINNRIGIEGKLFGRKISFEYNRSMVLCIKLSLIAPHACGITLICDYYFGISRRLTNAGYCAWILTLATALLTIAILVEIIIDILIHMIEGERVENDRRKSKKRDVKRIDKELVGNDGIDLGEIVRRSPLICEAINYNGLVFFLTCNVFTGIINNCLRTLYVEWDKALGIIIFYMGINIFIAVILYRNKIQIKL